MYVHNTIKELYEMFPGMIIKLTRLSKIQKQHERSHPST